MWLCLNENRVFSPNVMASFVKFNQEYDDTPCDCDTQTFWDTPNMSCLVDSNMVIWCLVEMVSPQLLVMFGYQRVSVKLHPCWSFRSFNDSSKFEYCIKGCQPHWGFGSVAWDVGTPRGTVRLQWPALLITFAQRQWPCQETYLTMTLQFISWVLCLVLFLMVLFICTELLKFVQRVTWIMRWWTSSFLCGFVWTWGTPTVNDLSPCWQLYPWP